MCSILLDNIKMGILCCAPAARKDGDLTSDHPSLGTMKEIEDMN